MAMTAQSIVQELINSTSRRSGLQLAVTLQQLSHSNDSTLISQLSAQSTSQRLSQSIQPPISHVITQTIDSIQQSISHQHLRAFDLSSTVYSSLFDHIEKDDTSSWLLPFLEFAVIRMRLSAYKATLEFKTQKHRQTLQQQNGNVSLSETSSSSFTNLSVSPVQTSINLLTTRVSSLLKNNRLRLLSCHILTQLIKLYFHTQNQKLCTPLLRMMDSAQTPDLSTFPTSHQASFLYYKARLLLTDEKYDESFTCLQQAFIDCPNEARHNKQQILTFLIPIRLYQHYIPTDELITKYQLTRQFSDICRSVATGDCGLFERSMNENRAFYMTQGIFLILAKLEQFVLLKLVQRCVNRLFKIQANQVPLDALLAAVQSTGGQQCDADELECMLANLIQQGLIKGYIAHQRCIVLSKQDPFPKPT